MTAPEKTAIGILISTEIKYGTEYLKVRLVEREPGAASPVNASHGRITRGAPLPEKLDRLYTDDLGIEAFASEHGDFALLGTEPVYRALSSLDLHDVEKMAKTLKAVTASIRKAKDAAYAAGLKWSPVADVIAFANAVGASFVAVPESTAYGSYPNTAWEFRPIEDATNILTKLATRLSADMAARKGIKAAA